MKLNILIRELNQDEIMKALLLAWDVFKEYEAPDYTEEGVQEFYKSIHDNEYITRLHVYGAFDKGRLVGVIATRNGGTHIALFFVDGQYQGQGIGKKLFQTVLKEYQTDKITDKMTVNSSPYAVPIYHKLGFRDVDTEQVVNGLRFTPMELFF